MQIIKNKNEISRIVGKLKKEGKKIGLVPTMGALHEGHLSLIKRCKEECDITIISIFVNPVQFGPNEDFARYPRDFERDREMASQEEVDIIFYPEPGEMYGDRHLTYVNVEKMEKIMCGKFRPGHFKGVCTVVLKLFNIIIPDNAYFGMKDFQQLAILKKMVSDLDINIQIVGCETVREPDGLALSSRNAYLNQEERKNANILFQAINLAESEVRQGRSVKTARISAVKMLKECSFVKKIDYFDIRDPVELKALKNPGKQNMKILIASAIWFGKTRLIDNKVVEMSQNQS
ncbi:MAG: pantoate--beta-alanine ligase [Actinomycetota bacterium]|nr:pantoate--beta-alanine ligase [Actinomycetota bacterium]